MVKKILLICFLFPSSTLACDDVDPGWVQSVKDKKSEAVELYGSFIARCAGNLVESRAELYGILLVENVSLNHYATTAKSDAMGSFQMKPGTRDLIRKNMTDVYLGDDLFDRQTSTQYACQYMRFMRTKVGIEDLARRIVGYHVGHNGVKKLTDKQVYSHQYLKKVKCAISYLDDTHLK